MNKKIAPAKMPDKCTSHLRAIHDTLDMLNGKWKIAIIGSLSFGKKRFMELQREVTGIGSKMLSKELRDLEINELVKRTVYDTKPVTVEYELTDYGKTLQSIINEMAKWGTQHRKRIMNVMGRKEEYA
ncbi:transcriptional regulator [Terrimonas sp.]|uniref:winged helix-turn-helix transcriptional regulator n=1 Tax=Terrimonas sp. TaxID=1914338 RepID=UPI000D50C770|nr:helix-turn-helix domain-containing protein [Terrimonas sp.]PVD54060.1 transcriptional regulator [Terrimonas sp.]